MMNVLIKCQILFTVATTIFNKLHTVFIIVMLIILYVKSQIKHPFVPLISCICLFNFQVTLCMYF